jgi:RimJ/RimL family protein N-acetyltransferase
MIAVRMATDADAEQVARLGRQFYEAGGLNKYLFEYSEDDVSALIAKTIAEPSACTIVAEDGDRIIGMAAAVSYNHFLSPSTTMAQELFWWIEPEHRGSGAGLMIMRALEDWAKSAGASVMVMVTLHGLGHERLDKIYRQDGYAPLEYSYMKRI